MGVSLGQCGPHPAVATLPAILSPLPPVSPASGFSQWGVLEGLLGVTVKQRPKGGALEGLMAPSTPLEDLPCPPGPRILSLPPIAFPSFRVLPVTRRLHVHPAGICLCQVWTEYGTPQAQAPTSREGPGDQETPGGARGGAAGGFREDFLEGAGAQLRRQGE